MPVPVRDTPYGRELYTEGQNEGRSEGRSEMLRELLAARFGEDDRLDAIIERLLALPGPERQQRLRAAHRLNDLA